MPVGKHILGKGTGQKVFGTAKVGDRGQIVMDLDGEEKKNTTVDDVLSVFNRISIECGN